MRVLLACLAAAALSACATSGPQPDPPAPPPPPPPPPPLAVTGTIAGAPCMLTIEFGSYAMGIDGAIRARVESLLVADRSVTGFDTRRWGREGEVTLCVRTRAAGDTARLFQAIRPMIPPRPRGPIAMRTSAGLSYQTPPR